MSLLFHINPVSGDCKNTTLKLFDDQIQAIQKSVRTIVEDGSCNKKNVVTNTHNAYSATTGKFTTPEQGLYIFSIDTLCDPGKYSHAGLYVNGKIKTWQACNNGGKSHWLTCSNSAVLLIQKGDVVHVADHHSAATTRGLFSDFSGAKLN
uniref:Uncharacterized protein n=1 Tax=Magallana gigas TaxID=29159 RepID=K1PSR0_MAGGI